MTSIKQRKEELEREIKDRKKRDIEIAGSKEYQGKDYDKTWNLRNVNQSKLNELIAELEGITFAQADMLKIIKEIMKEKNSPYSDHCHNCMDDILKRIKEKSKLGGEKWYRDAGKVLHYQVVKLVKSK